MYIVSNPLKAMTIGDTNPIKQSRVALDDLEIYVLTLYIFVLSGLLKDP